MPDAVQLYLLGFSPDELPIESVSSDKPANTLSKSPEPSFAEIPDHVQIPLPGFEELIGELTPLTS